MMPNALIRAVALSKTYGTQDCAVKALDNVDLEVGEGEFVCLVGPSGSGKSTLLHLLGTLDRPTAGRIEIDGVEVTRLDDRKVTDLRRQKIGFVFQMFHLVPVFSALDNVKLPLLPYHRGREVDLRARELLVRVGLGNRMHHLPAQLSGGEQQRVAIARALIANPKIILADEPTGNLDTGSRDEILRILLELNNDGRTILVVTHDQEVSNRAQRILHLSDGRLLQ